MPRGTGQPHTWQEQDSLRTPRTDMNEEAEEDEWNNRMKGIPWSLTKMKTAPLKSTNKMIANMMETKPDEGERDAPLKNETRRRRSQRQR